MSGHREAARECSSDPAAGCASTDRQRTQTAGHQSRQRAAEMRVSKLTHVQSSAMLGVSIPSLCMVHLIGPPSPSDSADERISDPRSAFVSQCAVQHSAVHHSASPPTATATTHSSGTRGDAAMAGSGKRGMIPTGQPTVRTRIRRTALGQTADDHCDRTVALCEPAQGINDK